MKSQFTIGLNVALLLAAAALPAQTREMFQTGMPKLLEREEKFELPTTRTKPEELVPFEGKVDRASYRLGPGDQVNVTVWGTEPLASQELTVSGDGRLLVPPAGALEVAGLTLDEAEKFISTRLSHFFSDETSITLSLVNARTFRVYAAGAILVPGTYAVTAVDRVSDLIRAADGIRKGGSRRRLRLYDRDRKLIQEVDLMRHAATGELQCNPHLVDGGIVEVPSIERYVVFSGHFPNLSDVDTVRVKDWNLETATEFTIEFKEGESLRDLLALTGRPAISDTALAGNAFVSLGQPEKNSFQVLTADMIDQPVQNGAFYDFPARNNWVFVTGSTNSFGRYLYKPGWKVQDYLGQAGGPNYNGSRKTIWLRRADGNEFKCSPGETIYPGDVIYVPEKFHFDRVLPVMAGVASALIFVIWGR
ncbi:MAG TPA: polysaccharide biosynthesis/export family protein [Candidatus Glassbacteria bacterium]|nr:polysaccharide biosynthesis/export family protein [Candidatus Glassbacteria bacterium]